MGKIYPKGTSFSTIYSDIDKSKKEKKKAKAIVTAKQKKADDIKRYGFDTKDMSNDQISDKMTTNVDKHYDKIDKTIGEIDESDSKTYKRRKQNVLSISYRKLLDQTQVLDSLQNTNTNYNNAIKALYYSAGKSGVSSPDKGVKEYHKQRLGSLGVDVIPEDETAKMTPEIREAIGAPPDPTLTPTKPISKKQKRINELLNIIGK